MSTGRHFPLDLAALILGPVWVMLAVFFTDLVLPPVALRPETLLDVSYVFFLLVGMLGCALIFAAKLPLYRQHRFLTLGWRAVPAERLGLYWRGVSLVAVAVVLGIVMLLIFRLSM